jgi:hypothetical protein
LHYLPYILYLYYHSLTHLSNLPNVFSSIISSTSNTYVISSFLQSYYAITNNNYHWVITPIILCNFDK